MEVIRVNVIIFKDDRGVGRYLICYKLVYLSIRACHVSPWPSHSRDLGSLPLCGTNRGQSGTGIDISLKNCAIHDSS
jgi:hypothetical protein